MEDVADEAGALEVDAVGGEAGGGGGEGGLDGGAVVEVGDVEGLVFDDGRDGAVAVAEAHVVVVHGVGAAAAAVVVGVHALVRDGGFAHEVGVGFGCHGVGTPGGVESIFVAMVEVRVGD